jgi:hypothetical protein
LLKEVRARLPHIRHLDRDIGAEASYIYGGLADDLELPAPSLEYFSLFCQGNWKRRIETDQLFVSDTLFGGSMPRLSCLELSNCNVSWNSPVFKCLTSIEILKPSANARPELAVWLDILDKIPQLKTLTLHEASPIVSPFPFYVKRTVTLPSLTHLDISASVRDCTFAIAHLVLPALTSLRLKAGSLLINGIDMQELLPHVARHAHGPQDDQPLQSMLIRSNACQIEVLVWPVPDIDAMVDDPPAFLCATLPPRVELSFIGQSRDDACLEIFGTVMAALPLESLVMLAAVNLEFSRNLKTQQFWLRLFPDWPLLQRVRLGRRVSDGFIKALLEDNDGECKNPLLPSLTELSLVAVKLDGNWTHFLCDALMKRVDQGVPLETLDLRMCFRDPQFNVMNSVAVRLLSEIVVDTLRPLDFLGPEDTEESRNAAHKMSNQINTMWQAFRPHRCSEDDYSEDEGNA